jgi:hypothetical protein
MHHIGQTVFPETVLKADKSDNHFLNYNYGVILENEPSRSLKKNPTLKSKLLFMDFRFNKFTTSTFYCTNGNIDSFKEAQTEKVIIKFGREGYEVNDVRVPGGTAISRRHCVIINCKDDVWIYDLDSTGTYVNGSRVINKTPLIGRNTIRISKTEYEFTNDKTKLF